MRPPWLRRLQVHTTFAHFRDMVESRGGSRWWNTNFAENAHIIAVKQPYRSGNKQAVNLQGQIASNYERKRITGEAARQLGVHQGQVRCHRTASSSMRGACYTHRGSTPVMTCLPRSLACRSARSGRTAARGRS